MTQQYPYGAPSYVGDPTAVMGRRIVAHIIDSVVIGVVAVFALFAFAHKTTGVDPNVCNDTARSCFVIGHTSYRTDGGTTVALILTALLGWIVVGMIEGVSGAFVGKRILGLRVVGSDGQYIGAGRGALRGFLMIVDSMFCFVIGLVTASATHPHRRVGDMAANSLVVGKEWFGHSIGGYRPSSYVPAPPPYTGAGAGAPYVGPWSTPTPTPSPNPTPAPAPTTDPSTQWRPPEPPVHAAPPPQAQVHDPTEPHWDPARNAWIAWEPTRSKWMQFDADRNEWREM